MAFRVGLHNLSKGVLSDELQGRIDVAAYNAGMKRCENAYILKYGGIAGRPGTRVVYETATNDVRLIPFEVAENQTYMMLFEQASMKPLYQGGVVLEEELVITGITNANPAKVTAAYHDFDPGDEVFIDGQTGMTELNGRIWPVLAVVDANNFTIDVNSTAFAAWSGNTGGITRSGAPTAPPAPPTVPAPATPPVEPPVGVGVGGGRWGGIIFGGGRFANEAEIP